MKRRNARKWRLASSLKPILALTVFLALTCVSSAAEGDATSPPAAKPASGAEQEEAVRVLRSTISKLDESKDKTAPTTASKAVPKSAEAAGPNPATAEAARVAPAPVEGPIKVTVIESAPKFAAVEGAVKPPAEAAVLQTPLQKISEGKTLYSFKADNLEIKKALALFARANELNIVPDLDLKGEVTVDIKDVPLATMMQALLDAHGYNWVEEHGLIRVHGIETRVFNLDYLRLVRNGQGINSVNLSSGGTSSGSGGGGGGGVGGGGGGVGGGGGGVGGGGSGGSGSAGGSMMTLKADNQIDFWKELEEQLKGLLSEVGKIAVNKTAGVIQVTDRPPAVKNVARFIDELNQTILRQVDIEAKIYDVTLNDRFQLGIDWDSVIARVGGGKVRGIGSGTTPLADGTPSQLLSRTLSNPNLAAGAFFPQQTTLNLIFQNKDNALVLQALKLQGDLSIVSQPRLRTVNNQTAIIKVGTDMPFFSQTTFFIPTATVAGVPTSTPTTEDTFQTITVGTILSITPQISTNGWLSLDVSPVITSLVETQISPSGNTTAPVLDIKQASTMVRVKSDETIIIGGLIQKSSAKLQRKVPFLADIPLLGRAFTGTSESKQKKELVIFLSPHIVDEVQTALR